MYTYCRFTACLLVCLLAVTGAHAAETTVNRIAAVVNGEMITLHDLRMHTAAELSRRRLDPKDPKAAPIRQDVLDSLINDILIRQEAKRYKVSVSDAEAREEIDRSIARTGRTPAQFEADLKSQGVTMQMYTERMQNNMLRSRMANYMVDRKIFVTAEQVDDYYARNRDKFQGEKTADFSVIMLPGNSDVQGIYKQIKAGTVSFEDAARKYSADRTAQEGGRIQGVPYERMPPEMQKMLNSLSDGGISQLLKTQGGFLVIRRNAINEAKPLTLQEARPHIEEILLAPLREERAKEYIQQLRSKAVIDIRI